MLGHSVLCYANAVVARVTLLHTSASRKVDSNSFQASQNESRDNDLPSNPLVDKHREQGS